MSPEKPTPQHDDEPTAESVIAKAINYRIDGGEILSFENIGAPMAVGIMAALKAAGFEITKRTELGVTKGLPGLAAEAGIGALNRLVAGLAPEVPPLPSKAEGGFQHAGQEAGKNIAGALEQIAPGSSDAASIGVQLGLNPDLPNAPQWVKQLLGQHDPLAAALDLIGRRTDIVAVKLPEPTAPDFTGVEWSDKAAGWDVFAYGSTERQGQIQIRTPEFVDPKSAGNLAAALLAAKAIAEASDGAK